MQSESLILIQAMLNLEDQYSPLDTVSKSQICIFTGRSRSLPLTWVSGIEEEEEHKGSLTGRYRMLLGASRSAAGERAGKYLAAACGKESSVVAKMTGITPVAFTCSNVLYFLTHLLFQIDFKAGHNFKVNCITLTRSNRSILAEVCTALYARGYAY